MDGKVPQFIDVHINSVKPELNAPIVIKSIHAECDSTKLQYQLLSGGYTNQTYLVHDEDGNNKVVLRLWSDTGIAGVDRDREVASMMAAYKSGCGPQVFAIFKNGVAMDYINGRLIKWEEMRDPHMARLLGYTIANFHYTDVNDPSIVDSKCNKYTFDPKPKFFETMKKGLEKRLPHLTDMQRDEIYQREIKPLEEYDKELKMIQENLDLSSCDTVLSHCDFWPPNVMYDESQGEEKGFTFYDDDDLRIMLRAYIERRAELKGNNQQITDQDVEEILELTRIWMSLNYFFWLSLTFGDYESTDNDYLHHGIKMQEIYYSTRQHILKS